MKDMVDAERCAPRDAHAQRGRCELPHVDHRIRVPRGARIATPTGLRPACSLRPQDRVVCRNSGALRVESCATAKEIGALCKISLSAYACQPLARALVLPGDQHLVLRDWRATALFNRSEANVRVERLIDGDLIRQVPPNPAPFVLLNFSAPVILYAEGLELASC
ncbi:MAG: Hint domain-containing protein [Pseudomonadota bacterium]